MNEKIKINLKLSTFLVDITIKTLPLLPILRLRVLTWIFVNN